MNRTPYVIIGNSVAAMGGVDGIRNTDAEGAITIIAKEPHHTYSRPLISYLLAGKVDEEGMLYRPRDFYGKNNVRPLLGVEVRGIDLDSRAVETSDGQLLAFEKLLIAAGGKPIVPQDVRGTEAEGVFTFSSWDDAHCIKAYIEGNGVRQAAVVGGGMIGTKAMEALAALDVSTTVVELTDLILSAAFDRTASDLARRRIEEAGVDVRLGTTVSSVEQRDGKVAGVVLRDGTRLCCELVVFAIGVLPNADVVKGTAVEVDRGILVDDSMQTSVDGIYAAGDVAQASDLLSGEKRIIPIFPNAYRQGLVAGANMAGGKRVYKGGIAMNAVDVFGLPTISLGSAGAEGKEYEILSDFDEDEPSYRKIVLKGDRVVGAIFVGQIDRAGIVTGLIRERIHVSPFKDLLLTDEFGLISLPAEYRKHVVSGMGIEV